MTAIREKRMRGFLESAEWIYRHMGESDLADRMTNIIMLYDVNVPPDYKALKLTSTQSGLYSPLERAVIIRSGMDKVEEDITIAHEWIHVSEQDIYACPYFSEYTVEQMAMFICSFRRWTVPFIRSNYNQGGF